MMNIHQFLAVLKFSWLFPSLLGPTWFWIFWKSSKFLITGCTASTLGYWNIWFTVCSLSIAVLLGVTVIAKMTSNLLANNFCHCSDWKKLIMTWTVMENISNVEWQSNSAKYFCLKFIHALQKNPFINVPSKYLYEYMYSKHFIINMIQFLAFYYWADIVVLHFSYKTFCISHVR